MVFFKKREPFGHSFDRKRRGLASAAAVRHKIAR
jgi:hypothetical protein